jgi:phenylpropionate dioxygenase-like ring-hydroxylating dioxygenase large terminal subunit
MFIPRDSEPCAHLRPASSAIAAGDWDILAHFWYPVAHLEEVGEAPFAARLLDVDLVLYRSEQGITAARDRCPHRHVRLSAGTVEGGQVICPYHALAFDGAGQCTRVPALGRDARLPASYRLETFPVEIRYGLVWTCLDPTAARLIPTLNGIPDDGTGIVFIKTRTWPVSAARQIENFFDLGHLPIVHGRTLGGNPADRVTPGKIDHQDDAVTLTAQYVETPFGGAPRPCQYVYRVILPFAIDFTVLDDTGHEMKLFDLVCPRSAYETRVFQFMKDTRDVDENHRALIEGLDAVNLEDMHILENLTMPDLPLDMRHEIHLQVDNIAQAYRQRLGGLGLGGPVRPREVGKAGIAA